MLPQLLICLALFLVTYALTTFGAKYFAAWNTTDTEYSIKHDPFIYIFLTTLIGTLLIYWFTPDLTDSVSPLKDIQVILPFLVSGLFYERYISVNSDRWLFTVLTVFVCALFCSSSINLEASPLNAVIPVAFQIIGIALLITLITLSSSLLIGLPSIFSLFISTSLLGIIILSFLGALPILFALFAGFSLGIWFAVYQSNRFERNIQLNTYALMSTTLLMCSLFSHAISEFSGPSVLILTFYPLSELICALFVTYILNKKETDLYLNTSYISAYQKDTPMPVLQTLLLKISVLNITLAAFQVYSVNSFTLPIIALLLNLWLLSKLYNIDKAAEPNNQETENVKKRKKRK